jgi:mannose-1-phosphate guanylyltransferase
MEGKILDEQILDLESLSTLLQNVFNRMDQAALDELAAAVTKERIQELVLEAIGVAKQRLSAEEQARLDAVIEYVLDSTRNRR